MVVQLTFKLPPFSPACRVTSLLSADGDWPWLSCRLTGEDLTAGRALEWARGMARAVASGGFKQGQVGKNKIKIICV